MFAEGCDEMKGLDVEETRRTLERGQSVFTEVFGENMPWTPPELAPQLVRVLASGRADKLSGRYIHAEHDDIEDLIRRADDIVEADLNAIRLQR